MTFVPAKYLSKTAVIGVCAWALLAPVACSSGSSGDSAGSSGGASNPGSAGKSSSGGASGASPTSGGSSSTSGGSAGSATSTAGAGGTSNGGRSGVAGAGGISTGGATQTGGASSAGSAQGGSQSGGTNNGGSGGASTAVNGTIVPLYTDPSDDSWTAIIAAKKAHPSVDVVAIVNPDNGPGSKVDSSYTKGIDALIAAGIVPIGYVRTGYTAQGEPAVEADIDSWHGFYPQLVGIFFDEQSDKATDAPFYADVSTYAKSKGFTLTVGNPGTSVPAAFSTALDVELIYESKGLPKTSTLSADAVNRAHYGVIPYGAAYDASFVAAAKADVKYIYATSDDLPNPWDSLTPYLDQLLGALE